MCNVVFTRAEAQAKTYSYTDRIGFNDNTRKWLQWTQTETDANCRWFWTHFIGLGTCFGVGSVNEP